MRLHSVHLDEEKCRGCTNCINHCPTEAIRVREGKARINTEKCIDCGECIRTCPNKAKTAVTDGLGDIERFKHTIALPAPAVYAQFERGIFPEKILNALISLGFSSVWEVARGADIATRIISKYVNDSSNGPRPLISSACPAVVRLIQVRFPELVAHLLPIKSPMDIIAGIAKNEISTQHGLALEDIGVFFITPCPAKAIFIKQPVGISTSSVDRTISIQDIYSLLVLEIRKRELDKSENTLHSSSGAGIGWASAGGEAGELDVKSHFSVDGIHNVISVLEEIEDGKLSDIDYVEAQACVGGCVGGPLTVENPFVAKVKVKDLSDRFHEHNLFSENEKKEIFCRFLEGDYSFDGEVSIDNNVYSIDPDLRKAIGKMEQLEKIKGELPGLDCGSCGAPNCQALAEDIIQELAQETDCIFKLREEVRGLAEKMLALAAKVPPAMSE